ncbi:hypothetical protein SLEP1_g26596 [Rubroshorea leprosula]|uniref:Diacylglycerol kinase accessory domain-containing protein n=1 Tax=Rubroshorea leprosula TaxID=152421 RepID=A0AAV5JQE7_9ROSI|nr:hypothetical protein SLEP1_g26596 [Rubroshorea leprosula]
MAQIALSAAPGFCNLIAICLLTSIRSIVCLNLPSFSGGLDPWGKPYSQKYRDVSPYFARHLLLDGLYYSYVDDGLTEIVGFRNAWQGLLLLAPNGHGTRLAQVKERKTEKVDRNLANQDLTDWRKVQPPEIKRGGRTEIIKLQITDPNQQARQMLNASDVINFELFYNKGDQIDLACFIDNNYVGDLDDRKSTFGFVFMLRYGSVSWSSKKQPIVTLSTIEAGYVVSTSCACQAIWLRRVLEKLELNQHEATSIYCDNSSAIKLFRNPVLNGRSKHIHVRYHFLRNLVEDGTIELSYCRTEDQVADIFTKPLKKQPLPTDEDTVVNEISHFRQVSMLATPFCRSKSVLDPSFRPSTQEEDSDSDEEEEERRKSGAAETFRLPDRIDIAHLS